MKKGLFKILVTAIVICSLTVPAYAAGTEYNYKKTTESTESDSFIMPLADEIVYRFRIVLATGKRQYRRWNQTKGYWVDPDWIDVPGQ